MVPACGEYDSGEPFGTLRWRTQGFAGGTISALVGAIAEIGLFAASRLILTQWSAGRPLLVRERRCAPMGVDGFQSAALGDDDAAMPARHELRRRASFRHVFPKPSGPRRSRRHSIRHLCRGGCRSGSWGRDRVLRVSVSALGGEAYAVMALLAAIDTVNAVFLTRRWCASGWSTRFRFSPRALPAQASPCRTCRSGLAGDRARVEVARRGQPNRRLVQARGPGPWRARWTPCTQP